MSSFSRRHGYSGHPIEIAFREKLPVKLRAPIVEILSRYKSDTALNDVAKALADPYGIDPHFPKLVPVPVRGESDASVHFLHFLLDCPWFQVYDVIEAVLEQLDFHDRELADPDESARVAPLQRDLNDYFVYAGIGWQLVNGKIVTRGDEAFESTLKTAVTVLEEDTKPTAAGHLKFATSALSARPTANTSGAVAHATSAVECVLGEITGKSMPLGKYLDKYSSLFHPALKKGLDGIYGYASDAGARHGKEGTEPSREEAEFVVSTCAAACTLLTRKHPK